MSRTLRDFYSNFFDTPSAANNETALAQDIKTAFQSLSRELQGLLLRQREYPFLYDLHRPLKQIEALARQPESFFLTDFHQQIDALLNYKETVIAPIRGFMAGEQKTIYDACQSFLRQQEENLGYVSADTTNALRELLADPNCYLGEKMLSAQQHMLSLQNEIQRRLNAERRQAQREISQRKQTLHAMDAYQNLSPDQQQQINTEIEAFIAKLDMLTMVTAIRNSRRCFLEEIYPALLTRAQGVPTISLHNIYPTVNQHLLVNEKETDAYLAQLRQAIIEALEKDNTISL
jgi:hypothetical protein